MNGPGKLLITADEVRAAVARVAANIRQAFAGRELSVVCVLDGALLFTADLVRQLDLPLRIETVSARSYRGADTTGGDLVVHAEGLSRLAGRHVLIVDDILDTGRTLVRLREAISAVRPASLASAVLLDKPGRRAVDIRADFVGIEIPDLFVVGYGMDHDGRWRNLQNIFALDEPPAG